jgi:hypothetical protein
VTRPTWLHARATAPPHHAARRCTLPPLGPRSSATVRLHPPHVPAGEPSSSRTAPCHGWPPTVACSIVRADVRRARRLGIRRAGDAVSNRRGASYRRPTALRISLHSLHTCRSGLREWGSCRVASAPHHRNSPLAFQTRVLGVRPYWRLSRCTWSCCAALRGYPRTPSLRLSVRCHTRGHGAAVSVGTTSLYASPGRALRTLCGNTRGAS